jgi:hypothetical protein
MSFEKRPKDQEGGFAEYKRNHEGAYSAERLVHYFNTEMGIASNLLNTLRARIESRQNAEGVTTDVSTIFAEISEHLMNSHEIGNLMSELLHGFEQNP